MDKNVTVVVTSSDRHDLLERTLDSFVACNTYPGVKRILIMEDSYRHPHFVDNNEKYAAYDISVLLTRPRLGQLLGIDVAYKYVDTEYIFHCEDDWEFYGRGFIETSFPILESSSLILQVHLRRLDELFPMGVLNYSVDAGGKFAIIHEGKTERGLWHGFSFNPGLRRLADYKRLGSYSAQLLAPRYTGQHFEAYLGTLYKELGYTTAISLFNEGKGFVRHIGDGRHVS
ncbi:MAG: glycosyl transferase [Deltaproteobacteria bacterium]|jgi:hypothetical protein|nr:glycosyl transferase [Deltaproteobacteria bacterium]